MTSRRNAELGKPPGSQSSLKTAGGGGGEENMRLGTKIRHDGEQRKEVSGGVEWQSNWCRDSVTVGRKSDCFIKVPLLITAAAGC